MEADKHRVRHRTQSAMMDPTDSHATCVEVVVLAVGILGAIAIVCVAAKPPLDPDNPRGRSKIESSSSLLDASRPNSIRQVIEAGTKE